MKNIISSLILLIVFASTFTCLQLSKQKIKSKNSSNTKKELTLEVSDEITVDVPEQVIEINTKTEKVTKTTSDKDKASKQKSTVNAKLDTDKSSNIIKKHIPATSYIVRGKRYYTISSTQAQDFSQVGTASWYGPGFHGKKTANGEIYNQNALTGAHKSLPLNTKVKVTSLENNKSIIIRINDRGPYHGNRILDLSKKAAEILGVLKNGTSKIKLQVIG